MTVVVLHLSDIHIKTTKDPILGRAQDVARTCYRFLPTASAVFIVVSGDVAYSGTKEQYIAALSFFNELKLAVQAEKNLPIYFIPCPGNHDCDFSADHSTRKLVLSAIQAQGPAAVDDSVIRTCTSVQNAYFDFEQAMTQNIDQRDGDELWKSYEFEIDGSVITFDALNVAWASQIHEEQGTLTFPFQRYEAKLKEQPDLRIGVLHQPMNWFGQATYRPFRQFIRSLENIVMTGHEHVGAFGENTDTESGNSSYVEGFVLQGEKDLSDSGFGVIELNLIERTYRATKYVWSGEMYLSSDEGSWQDYRSLPLKQRNPFSLTHDFTQRLQDPGGNFKSVIGEQISLEDIYVYPDMQTQENEDIRELRRASALKDIDFLNGGVLLQGEEKVGATSLLFQLYKAYHSAGYVPIYLYGCDLKNFSNQSIDEALKRAVTEQYGLNAWSRIEQTCQNKKILLLDDFDDSPVKMSQHRSRLLSALLKKFKVSVVTVGELFSIADLYTAADVDSLKGFRRFRLLPFGYARRAELVKRWFQLTARDGTISDEEFSAKCDSAEKLFDTVMVRNIIPALPLYLLTLLQGIDAGAAGNFHESGLGRYYGFLFDESLKNAGISSQKWGRIVEYCAHLAWHFHEKNAKELDKSALRSFNKNFSSDEHSVDFDGRLDDLIRSRVLTQSGDYYSFRYHYIYYYLKGYYLSRKIDEQNVQEYIKRCCKHLYARENANTLLFLAHHAHSNKFFLSCMIGAMDEPFADLPEARFDGVDTINVGLLLAEAPKLAYTGDSPTDHREKLNREKDEQDDGFDGLADKEEDNDILSLPAQVASTLKTVEILGQLLKNQYAGFNRMQRVDMLNQLMRGPLRGIFAVLTSFVENREAVIAELEDLLEKKAHISDKDRRTAMARKMLAHLLQMSAFGFVLKTAASMSYRELHEDIHVAVENIGTPAAKLIELAVKLDSPEPLPRDFIRKLHEETKKDVVGGSLIQLLALQRLYMFKISHGDKQWLDSQNILDVRQQDAISFNNREIQLLKA